MRGRQPPVRRRQGRRDGRPASPVDARARALTRRYMPRSATSSAGQGHSSARRQHERPGYGVGHGYLQHAGRRTPRPWFTGKPIAMGGSLGPSRSDGARRDDRDAGGPRHLGLDITQCTVAVQGFGNVGSVSADLLQKIGAKIVAVTDWKGGVYNASRHRRRTADRLDRAAQDGGGVSAGRAAGSDRDFGLDVDVLIPAALENQITMKNAPASRRRSSPRARTDRPHPKPTSTCTSAASS